jgi:hypothetical protein
LREAGSLLPYRTVALRSMIHDLVWSYHASTTRRHNGNMTPWTSRPWTYLEGSSHSRLALTQSPSRLVDDLRTVSLTSTAALTTVPAHRLVVDARSTSRHQLNEVVEGCAVTLVDDGGRGVRCASHHGQARGHYHALCLRHRSLHSAANSLTPPVAYSDSVVLQRTHSASHTSPCG